jgi:hypothetical protein
VVEHPAAIRQVLGSNPSVPWDNFYDFIKIGEQAYFLRKTQLNEIICKTTAAIVLYVP